MSSKKLKIRLGLLILITIIFSVFFLYYLFTSSRASGSPLNDKEYMEQLAAASKRYQVAGNAVVTPSVQSDTPKEQNQFTILQSVLSFLQNLVK